RDVERSSRAAVPPRAHRGIFVRVSGAKIFYRVCRARTRSIVAFLPATERLRSGLARREASVGPQHRVARQLGGRSQLDLGIDVRAVGLDGLRADLEAARDVRDAESAPDQLEDLELAVGELLDDRGPPALLGVLSDGPSDESGRHGRADRELLPKNLAD